MHRCYVPEPGAASATLSEDESHHLTRVLRLDVGDDVVVFDGRGREWLGRISATGKSSTTVELIEARHPIAEPPVAVTLAVALLKGDQMNGVVRDATMLGATVIAPFLSDHVALPERAWRDRLSSRWERVAIASAKQCGRAVVPAIRPLSMFEDILALETEVRICCVEPGVAEMTVSVPIQHPVSSLSFSAATLLVGPEGGWSAGDLARAGRHGAQFLSLGPRTLRAETAPTVALSVLWSWWGWSRSHV